MSERKPLYDSPGEKGKRGFEDLECYQLAVEVVAKIHTFAKTLPSDEKFDMYAQIRRASKNVTGNIGEAYGRYHFLDIMYYYSIARGELNETLARLIDARVLEYINQADFESLYKLIRKAEQALNRFMSYVRRQRAGSQEYGDKKFAKTRRIMMQHRLKTITKKKSSQIKYPSKQANRQIDMFDLSTCLRVYLYTYVHTYNNR